MPCQNCLLLELTYEFILEGYQNKSMIHDVVNHLFRRDIWVETKDQRIIMKESGVREFLDFCNDHMKKEEINFRIEGQQQWNPLNEMEHFLEAIWIDDIIKKKLIICHFQPIVDDTESIYGYEILARFQHQDGTIIYPNEIFSAARKRGRLYALDRLCRLTAVKYAAKINKKAFINFIPTSIYSPEFCLKSTVSLANHLGIDPQQFVFEVVESDKVDDIEHLKSILTYYKKKGFQYALDDVGEGYSTIDMLSNLKPQYMKLDMKYAQGVATDPIKQKIAQTFLNKANEIQSTPLAEGIETRADFEWLKEAGYQLFQGYLFGKPTAEPAA